MYLWCVCDHNAATKSYENMTKLKTLGSITLRTSLWPIFAQPMHFSVWRYCQSSCVLDHNEKKLDGLVIQMAMWLMMMQCLHTHIWVSGKELVKVRKFQSIIQQQILSVTHQNYRVLPFWMLLPNWLILIVLQSNSVLTSSHSYWKSHQ